MRFIPNVPFVTKLVTNWMTAAGLAFIAGGLATLISLRHVIFGIGAGRATRTGTVARRRRPEAAPVPVAAATLAIKTPAIDAPMMVERLPAAIPAAHELLPRTGFPLPPATEFPLPPPSPDFPEPPPPGPDLLVHDAYEDAEPAEIALGTDPEYDDDPGYEDLGIDAAAGPVAGTGFADETPSGYGPFVPMQPTYAPVRPEVDRSDIGYGDRVDDWVRPRYQDLDDRPPAGDYWTPVPDDLYADPEPSARGYGWPVPVERLPPVPSYEPATGFDLTPVQAAEPTTFVTPPWPPAAGVGDRPRVVPAEERRVRQARSWRERDDNRAWRERDEIRFRLDREESRTRRDREENRSRRERDDYRAWRERDEKLSDVPRSAVRRRPRPRPSAQAVPGYVSRHSAGPYG